MTENTCKSIADAISLVAWQIDGGRLRTRLCPICEDFWRCCTCRELLGPDGARARQAEPLRENTLKYDTSR